MKTHLIAIIMFITVGGLVSCEEKDDPAPQMSLEFDFEEGKEGWVADFADYHPNNGTDYQLSSDISGHPAPLDTTQAAFRISGMNRSDDLFMFLKRKIDGLQPNTTYELTFDLSIVSSYPENSVGIGGSPGASVYLKAGASPIEPKPVWDTDYTDFLVMNIDKGAQSNPGPDMQVLGTIGIEKEEFEPTLISRSNEDTPFEITSDENGSMWVIVGTDSGYEGLTNIYYHEIKLNLTAID